MIDVLAVSGEGVTAIDVLAVSGVGAAAIDGDRGGENGWRDRR